MNLQLSVTFVPAAPNNLLSTPVPTTPTTPTMSSSQTLLAFTFLDDYRLDLSVRSLLGSRSRLQDVPKIAQLVESRIHAWFDDRCVEPKFQQVVLPSLWPRKRNTRGGEGAGAEGEKSESGTMDGNGDPGVETVGGIGQAVSDAAEGVERRRWENLGQDEGPRWRGHSSHGRERSRSSFSMPGSMPEMVAS